MRTSIWPPVRQPPKPFGPAQNLGPPVNSLGFGDYSPELSLDGLTLYFSSSRPGGLGEADLYVTTRASIDDPWEPPQNLGPSVNTRILRGPAEHLSEREDSLLGFGPARRLRRLRYLDGDAGERRRTLRPAVNVGPAVNTAGPEFGPALSQNEKQLFFSSARPGNVGQIDIWVVERQTKSEAWGTPDQYRYAELAILPGDADVQPQWPGGLLHVVSAWRLRRARRLVRQSLALRHLHPAARSHRIGSARCGQTSLRTSRGSQV